MLEGQKGSPFGQPVSSSNNIPPLILSETHKRDPLGRRIQKTVGSTLSDYLYSGEDLVGEYTANNWSSPTARYTHGPGIDWPLLGRRPTGSQYYHSDGLGSIVAVTDPNGLLAGSTRYDAWGNPQAQTGSLPQYGYTGREPDATGLIYYRARYYDPSIGRFTQRDPIGLQGGVNPYAYVNNNPTNFVDPNGLVDLYYDLNNPVPSIANSPLIGMNIFVQGGNGQYYPSVDFPPMGGHNAVISESATARTINDIIGQYANNPPSMIPELMDVYQNSGKGGQYDFKSTNNPIHFEKNSMYIVDGQAHRYDYPANVAWGGVVESKGIPESMAIIGSHFQAILDEGRLDDARDIEAIKRGYDWNYSSGGATGYWGAGATGSWGSGNQNIQSFSNPPINSGRGK